MLQTLYKNTNNTNTIDIDIDIVIDIWVRFVRLTPYENFFAPCGRSIDGKNETKKRNEKSI
jgi:hypothetical protein